jgi:hypothetical protein
MTELKDELLELEIEGWKAISEHRGGQFYSTRLTPDALMVLPGGMVLDRNAVIAAFDGPTTWSWFRIEAEQVIQLSEDAAALTYKVTAQRTGEDEYTALMTSTYVRRKGDWMMALHQQTLC